jgi:hypothetical protein
VEGGSGEGRGGRITEATVADHRTIHSLSLSGSGPRILIASARSLQPERDQDDDVVDGRGTRSREGGEKEPGRRQNRPSNVAYVSVGGKGARERQAGLETARTRARSPSLDD